MPRTKSPGWSPMNLTLSESAQAFLREEAERRGTSPGKIADKLIQEARARRGQTEIALNQEHPGKQPEPKKVRTTKTEEDFYLEHEERINVMGSTFRTKLAYERRLAQRGKPWSGQAWGYLDTKERSKIGARLIAAANRDIVRWRMLGAIPTSQHQIVKRVLDLYGRERVEHVQEPVEQEDSGWEPEGGFIL